MDNSVVTSKTQTVAVQGGVDHEILSAEAMAFLEKLHDRFQNARLQLLQNRVNRQKKIDQGELPDFLPETKKIRESNWSVADVPDDLQDRRVEITGPAGDAKMVINALNSGAKVFMADFEDANSPTWENSLLGQVYLRDAIRGELEYTSLQGKEYRLHEKTATLVVRPRGWHLEEKHLSYKGEPMSGSLVDFGLYFFHNAKALIEKGSGPYFYLPKLEGHLEARLWNEVFVFAQEEMGIPQGTVKATVLIETILATFEAEEILYELQEHSAGLNCGRWDYIFSYIKKLKNHTSYLLPDRAHVTMTVPFMRAYTQFVIKVCHKRGAHAIGGMAAQIPIKNNPEANEEALQKVKTDKEREAADGHDGSWVAHPGLVPVVLEVFDRLMPSANQLEKQRNDVVVTAEDLLQPTIGPITENGLRTNISVGIQYIAAWLTGRGAVPLNHLMEDAATAEISRAQVWQWIRHTQGVLEDGRQVTLELVGQVTEEEVQKIKTTLNEQQWEDGRFEEAITLFEQLVRQDEFIEFLTLPGYTHIK
ncbi:malate synthase A [Fictibacillus sp. FJAT-27399]|uniref:malate synthase A n=1 Tax=Fictibacillus sp. FJAT-27399 TaxID=1729689 RepID=UPI0009E7968E|nr:malate synthase A [Fictibacillus sp. FJAT-27399]